MMFAECKDKLQMCPHLSAQRIRYEFAGKEKGFFCIKKFVLCVVAHFELPCSPAVSMHLVCSSLVADFWLSNGVFVHV